MELSVRNIRQRIILFTTELSDSWISKSLNAAGWEIQGSLGTVLPSPTLCGG